MTTLAGTPGKVTGLAAPLVVVVLVSGFRHFAQLALQSLCLAAD